MIGDEITVRRDGMILTGPGKVRRDSFIRVRVEILTDDGRATAHDAWADAVDLAYSVYGAVATEDNTVGQLAQVDGVRGERKGLPVAGRVFSLGLNLYGFKVSDIRRRIAAAVPA